VHLRARGCENDGQVEGGLVEIGCTPILVEFGTIICFFNSVLPHTLDQWVLLSEEHNAIYVR